MGDVRTRVARRLTATPTLPATITPDARKIDPREVARVSTIIGGNRLVNPHPETWQNTGQGGYQHGGEAFATPPRDIALAWDRCPEIPGAVVDDGRTVEPATLPSGTVAYMDPPYQGTTPYAHLLPRADVVDMARRWREADATVCISEAEPIPALMADGWHAVEITDARKGQKRTFSKQQREWLTMSRPPCGQWS